MIRYLEQEEKPKIRELFDECFHGMKELTDYYFEHILPTNYVVVNEQDEQIVSACQLVPKRAVVGQVKTIIPYIYGVGTLKYQRQNGYCKELLEKVIKDFYADMEAFTYLIPIDSVNATIYRKLGFEYVMDKKALKSDEQRRKPTHSLMTRRADESDISRLAIFAQSSTEHSHLVTIVRDNDYFKRINRIIAIEGGHIDIYFENRVIMGYRIWINGKLFEEVLDDSIKGMSFLEHEGTPYLMARIINVRKTLRLLNFQGMGSTVIKISDPVIEENNGVFRLKYHHGNIKLDKLDEEVEPEVEVGIAELTAHVFGYAEIDGLPKICPEDSVFINDQI